MLAVLSFPGLLFPWALAPAQTVVATLAAGSGRAAVNPVTHRVYTTTCILNQRKAATNGTVTVIDTETYTTVATITAGVCPSAIAVNSATNKIYVANAGQTSIICGSCFNFGSITIIDGASNTATTISDPNVRYPQAIAVNPATNRIYVANSDWGVTVIDGNTDATVTVVDPNASNSADVAVNVSTNKIYVANMGQYHVGMRGNVTVIDGATNATTTVTDPGAVTPSAIAVNPKTNRIYVANQILAFNEPNRGNVTVIDGATNATTTVTAPDAIGPQAIAVNQVTNKIYVANINDTTLSDNGGVTVIDGATNSVISVRDPNAIAPVALAVDEMTNKVYVANEGSSSEFTGNNPGSITVIDGATNATTTIIDPKSGGPHAVAVNAMVDQIYVVGGGLTVIDGSATAKSHVLSLLVEGTGTGTVRSTPAGMDCGASCSASFPVGTPVSLSASAASGSLFSAWSGPCSGAGACDVIANQDQFVTATFNSAQVAVPNVVGDTQDAATSIITGTGLVVGTVTRQSDNTFSSGSVISESPAAGTTVAGGSAVNLVVSTGATQVPVPGVVGQTQSAATTAITGAGLVLGTVTQQSNSTVASGYVISESPTAGTNVTSGSPVNLVVSTGGSGGGGGIDELTLGALLNLLILSWRRGGPRRPHVDFEQ
jgi:DNA-binding beta-propeller fold protein YncE